ncbi:MAG: A/G-specific adenine glycosylase [Myxococcota bacterium]|nr:A/G-specific adenine glycosylase [Myxococcota bacterium]
MNRVSKPLLEWYDAHRRILPWRENPEPYWVWVSEVMLQQTRVETGLRYFERFIERFPTVEALARAPLDDVLVLWSGLGYYSRARNLHKAAGIVADAGAFPTDVSGLRALPGVGEYMAAAIASIALGQDEATVDGNIARVMARIHADAGGRKQMWVHARTHLPAGRAGDYNQALMDLGATICTPRKPLCDECPIRIACRANQLGKPLAYPPAKEKKAVPRFDVDLTIHTAGRTVWAGRRPETGLWSGLWAFPEVHCPLAKPLGSFKHVLSHKRLNVRVWVSSEPPPADGFADWTAFEWMTPEELRSRGTSVVTDKCLDLYEEFDASASLSQE